MDSIHEAKVAPIWQEIVSGCLKREGIEPRQVCYDGTNFYTFIGTFNTQGVAAILGTIFA
jgi:hypothetical protein